MKAGAVYEHKYLLGTSLARPVIAKAQVEVALREGATAVAHGCTGKGNDQVRFEHAFQALAPQLKIIAPWREWTIKSREDAIDYAEARNIPITASREKIHSRDRNLWHLSHEGGELEDPANAPLESTWQWTTSPKAAPDKEEVVEIEFDGGAPVAVNGKKLAPAALLGELNDIGARNGVGRVDLVENRFVGIKSRGCYETPGGTLILTAQRELESLCLDRDLLHYKQEVSLKYAELVYYGLWFTPAARVAGCVHQQHAAKRDWDGEARPVQGQREYAFAEVTFLAIPHGHCFVHHGRQLRPERRGRIHPHSWSAGAVAGMAASAA